MFPNRWQPNPDSPYHELRIDLDDPAETGRERLPILQQLRQRPIRRTVRSAALIAAAATALLAAHNLSLGNAAIPPPPSAQHATAQAHESNEQRVRLTAPATATPGQHLIVLGHRNSNLCGPAELRFDGRPVRHQILAHAGQGDNTYQQLFLSMDVPRSAAPGTHHIDLFGPVRSTNGSTCGDVPERQARIDQAAISISAAPQD